MTSTAPFGQRKADARLSGLFKPYWHWTVGLVVLTLLGNGLNLAVPRIIAWTIDGYTAGTLRLDRILIVFGGAAAGIFALAFVQAIVQTYVTALVARDLRNRLAAKISGQNNAYVQEVSVARLVTNLTSDVDYINMFVPQAVVAIVSSAFLIVGASSLMFSIDWRLALGVVFVLPLLGVAFLLVQRRARKLVVRSRAAIDWLNRVINESIVGSSLIRLLNAQQHECQKFLAANSEALGISLAVIRVAACVIPVTVIATNIATLVILTLGGHFVVAGRMSLGDFMAFNSYLAMLFVPIVVIGFMSNAFAQASAAYERVAAVLAAPPPVRGGRIIARLRGDVTVSHLTLQIGQRRVLDDVSLHVPARTRTAILGPTAAGKTQLLHALAGLVRPQSGEILLDGKPIDRYDKDTLRRQFGFVFQDSVMFNLTMRENIAFSDAVDDACMIRALQTAELADFIVTLPDGIETMVSERGTSLSGGQRQRVMLARALALEPRILVLDDFTARVDVRTEQRILANVRNNYPDMTVIAVTQKIASVEDYDQIVLLMEGQLLARGTHAELMHRSPEYLQIYGSQQSTEDYELRA